MGKKKQAKSGAQRQAEYKKRQIARFGLDGWRAKRREQRRKKREADSLSTKLLEHEASENTRVAERSDKSEKRLHT